jgi:hypothetical protein
MSNEPECQRLAFEIADEDAAALIECNCVDRETDGVSWWDLKSADPCSLASIRRAARYLTLRGKLTRHPQRKYLVSITNDSPEVAHV